ncbi:hypothetical protein [Hymenobacter psychrophilus]|uniref:LTXXQ motif family protein n=1 Tax=Hymenobacter psychrophilus TaxID=651662 RepID=A0A1H3JUC3_9BACT|nr:hypothetical protein [Hymenobacter psychrophilus]SDY43557.1 hypothetical protein SAMN04488069_108219 [Hymenobacter psychrophilus]
MTLRTPFALVLAAGLLGSACARRPAGATSTAAPTKSGREVKAEAKAVAAAPPAARDLTDVLTEQLSLTDEQRSSVRQIFTSTLKQAQQAQERLKSNRPALLAELKSINASSDRELQQVLSPEQYQQLKAKQKQVQEQMRARKAQ